VSAALDAYLTILFGRAPDGALVELRQVKPPRQEWRSVRDLPAVAERVLDLGQRRDTFVGVAPRCKRDGGRDAIENSFVLHVDLDYEGAVDRLAGFEPAPTLVVWSGSGGAHAYWSLTDPVPPEQAERANRRLAHHLGGDPQSVDASRILRPPGTLNFKHTPPVRVWLDAWRGAAHRLTEVVGELPDPLVERAAREARQRLDPDDPLHAIPPAVYFEVLLGLAPNRDDKVVCPFHPDTDPSLHLYADAARGWSCYGCRRGGSIIDLGAELWGIEPRGAGFHEIRRRLREALAAWSAAA
jgi:hypothetical protein